MLATEGDSVGGSAEGSTKGGVVGPTEGVSVEGTVEQSLDGLCWPSYGHCCASWQFEDNGFGSQWLNQSWPLEAECFPPNHNRQIGGLRFLWLEHNNHPGKQSGGSD